VVGNLQYSRINFCCLVNDDRVYLIGGYDEYKKKYLNEVEVIIIGEGKVQVSSEFPPLNIPRVHASSLIIHKRHLYVIFGKAKKGRGERF
jgi:hypothetical protein